METGTEKREGEPRALFRVGPFFGGYYKQHAFNKFDIKTLRWDKPENVFHEAEAVPIDILKMRIFSGKATGGNPLPLPIPDDWAFDPESVQTDVPEGSVNIVRSQSGRWYLHIEADGEFAYSIKGGPRKMLEKQENPLESEMDGELPEELTQKIDDLKKNRLPKMRQMRELAKFVRSHLIYSNNNEAWRRYADKSNEFFKRIWDEKESDCFVANTLAARALSEIEPSVRFIGGFSVRERNQNGEAVLHTGNGHAWLEVWDEMSGRAVRLDVTPVGVRMSIRRGKSGIWKVTNSLEKATTGSRMKRWRAPRTSRKKSGK